MTLDLKNSWMRGYGFSGENIGTNPPMEYVSRRVLRSENAATKTMPRSPIALSTTKCSATAVATAVPRLWPTSPTASEATWSSCSTQSTTAIPSVISPLSVGEPVEYPKPR